MPVLREHRLWPPRTRGGGGRTDGGAVVLHQLGCRPSASGGAGGAHRGSGSGRFESRLLRHQWRGRRGLGGQTGPPVPQADRQSAEDQGHRPSRCIPRHHAEYACAVRHPGARGAVRAPDGGGLARSESQHLPPTGRCRSARVGGGRTRPDRVREPRNSSRGAGGTRPVHGWVHPATRGLPVSDPRNLR